MKNKVDSLEQNGSGYLKDKSITQKAKFDSSIKQITKLLQDMRIEKSSYAENKTNREVVSNLQNQIDFRKRITELVDFFIGIINSESDSDYSHICLFIDDLDLVPNSITYETLNDIFKFLQFQNKIIIFLAYREEQLVNSVIDDLLYDNKNILKRQSELDIGNVNQNNSFITADEMKQQAANIIEKGLPRGQRVYLLINKETEIKQVLEPFIIGDNHNNDFFYNKSVTEFIREQIIKQTRLSIEPIDTTELTGIVYPKQLRGLLQFLEIILTLEECNTEVKSLDDLQYFVTTLKKNIKTLKYYYISKFRDKLSKGYMSILEDWLEQDYSSRNSLIVVSLLDLVKKNRREKDTIDGFLTESEKILYYKSSYNVSLGNVFSALESFKIAYYGKSKELNFLYAIKILYSIENLLALSKSLLLFSISPLVKDFYKKNILSDTDYFLTMSENNEEIQEIYEEIKLDQYFGMVKGKIMPDNFFYSDLINKDYHESIFSTYYVQKMFFSDITAKGDVRKYGYDSPVYDPTEKYFSYKYREFFNKSDFKQGSSYLVDPFSSLTDTSYVLEVFYRITHEKIYNDYLFYNMFDLDLFVRKNYTRQSQNIEDGLYYTVERINDIFENNLSTTEENKSRKNMSIPLITCDNFNFNPIIDMKKLIEEQNNVVKNEINNKHRAEDELVESMLKFLKEQYEIYDIFSIGAYDIKSFLRDYWSLFNKWPKNMTSKEQDRANSMLKKGNRNQITKIDADYIDKIVNDFEKTVKKTV